MSKISPRNLELLDSLPTPLAQQLSRCRNAKSVQERHNCALALAEACLKLAAAVRINLLLAAKLPLGRDDLELLSRLSLPSMGHWVKLLRRSERLLAELPADDSAVVTPHRGSLESLPDDLLLTHPFLEVVEQEGLVSSNQLSAVRREGIIGFFSLLTTYRNTVIGHGAERQPDFYERLGHPLLQAVEAVLGADVIFQGARLVAFPFEQASNSSQRVELHGARSAQEVQRSLEADSSDWRLGFERGTALTSLFPLVVLVREPKRQSARFGFLNRTAWKEKKKSGEKIVRRADYLDYPSGEQIPFADPTELSRFLSSFLERSLSRDDFEKIQERTLSDDEDAFYPIHDVGKLIGEYETLGLLGQGGMGTVYRARRIGIERIVALKVHTPSEDHEVSSARFAREVAALNHLDHPNVVGVYGSGHAEGKDYFAMEYVPGRDLAECLKQSRQGVASEDATFLPFPDFPALARPESVGGVGEPASAVDEQPTYDSEHATTATEHYRSVATLFGGAALGLDHSHQHGIIHRDLKPSNLILNEETGKLVIADFGLAKLRDSSRDLTSTGAGWLGTLGYTAPEYLRGSGVQLDHRSDIFSLGASLFEAATRTRFREGKTAVELIQSALHDRPPSPRAKDPQIPEPLERIILKATAGDPRARYNSAAQFAHDLLAFSAGKRVKTRAPSHPRIRSALYVLLALVLIGTALITSATFLRSNVASFVGDTGRTHADHLEAYSSESASDVSPPSPDISDEEVLWYANWTRNRGMMVGIGQLSVEEVSRRAWSYRFVMLDGLTLRVETRNGLQEREGCPPFVQSHYATSIINPCCVYNHSYRADRSLSEITCLGAGDRIRYRRRFTRDGERCDFLDPTDRLTRNLNIQNARFWGDVDSLGPDIFGEAYKYDSSGFLEENLFVSPNALANEPRANWNGHFGYRFERDPLTGFVTRRQALDAEGSVFPTPLGMGDVRFLRNHRGDVLQEWRHDTSKHSSTSGRADEAPGQRVDGARHTYDDAGNVIETVVVDRNGNAAPGYKQPITRLAYDKTGNQVSRCGFDRENRPVYELGGAHCSLSTFDSQGNLVRSRSQDSSGFPINDWQGVADWRQVFDAAGNAIETAVYDYKGNPAVHSDGSHIERRVYDKAGNEIETRFFGTDGRPTLNTDGYATRLSTYDTEKNRIVSIDYLDVTGMPITLPVGYSRISPEYDERGNLTAVFALGPGPGSTTLPGRQVQRTDGYSYWKGEYDSYGRIVRIRFFDKNDRLSNNIAGVAEVIRGYPSTDGNAEVTFHDKGGRSVRSRRYPRKIRRSLKAWCRDRSDSLRFGEDVTDGFCDCLVQSLPSDYQQFLSSTEWWEVGLEHRFDEYWWTYGVGHCLAQQHKNLSQKIITRVPSTLMASRQKSIYSICQLDLAPTVDARYLAQVCACMIQRLTDELNHQELMKLFGDTSSILDKPHIEAISKSCEVRAIQRTSSKARGELTNPVLAIQRKFMRDSQASCVETFLLGDSPIELKRYAYPLCSCVLAAVRNSSESLSEFIRSLMLVERSPEASLEALHTIYQCLEEIYARVEGLPELGYQKLEISNTLRVQCEEANRLYNRQYPAKEPPGDCDCFSRRWPEFWTVRQYHQVELHAALMTLNPDRPPSFELALGSRFHDACGAPPIVE